MNGSTPGPPAVLAPPSEVEPEAAARKPGPDAIGLRLREGASGPDDGARARRRRTSELDAGRTTQGPLGERLARLRRSMDVLETAQLRALDGFVRITQGRMASLRTAVTEAGLDPDRLQPR